MVVAKKKKKRTMLMMIIDISLEKERILTNKTLLFAVCSSLRVRETILLLTHYDFIPSVFAFLRPEVAFEIDCYE
jgi:hypothetical protein